MQNSIKNEKKKRKRTMEKAKGLSGAELMHVLAARAQAKTKTPPKPPKFMNSKTEYTFLTRLSSRKLVLPPGDDVAPGEAAGDGEDHWRRPLHSAAT